MSVVPSHKEAGILKEIIDGSQRHIGGEKHEKKLKSYLYKRFRVYKQGRNNNRD